MFKHGRFETLRGQTLMEVLTSLSVLALVGMLGMELMGTMMGPLAPHRYLQSSLVVCEWLERDDAYTAWDPVEWEVDGHRIIIQTTPSLVHRSLQEYRVEVWRGNRLVVQRTRLIRSYGE
ncbi:hypothetical protein [Pontibacter sp. G13]|uniref:hypothetical protein n=1 Tax=Pontibacter sp. G13 TaxID=3074898 RepID=UPI00288BCAA5|nr:hypothetical protein [Pontibacter sp. G13]WNJ21624.1 hypothetical protein RJD25_28910 [Pontibacter sp. G13]